MTVVAQLTAKSKEITYLIFWMWNYVEFRSSHTEKCLYQGWDSIHIYKLYSSPAKREVIEPSRP